VKREKRKCLCAALMWLGSFGVWTAALCRVDVAPIGPKGTSVGFAALNGFVHELIGVHMTLYRLTDWLSLVPLGIAAGFALLGLIQWMRRKRLGNVDRSILVLGGFYSVVVAAFVLFEKIALNYRPVLIEGRLEASYPSSTTLLVVCVMSTAVSEFNGRIGNTVLRKRLVFGLTAFSAAMVLGRFLSGVHWVSDIVGAMLLSAGLVNLYVFLKDPGKK